MDAAESRYGAPVDADTFDFRMAAAIQTTKTLLDCFNQDIDDFPLSRPGETKKSRTVQSWATNRFHLLCRLLDSHGLASEIEELHPYLEYCARTWTWLDQKTKEAFSDLPLNYFTSENTRDFSVETLYSSLTQLKELRPNIPTTLSGHALEYAQPTSRDSMASDGEDTDGRSRASTIVEGVFIIPISGSLFLAADHFLHSFPRGLLRPSLVTAVLKLFHQSAHIDSLYEATMGEITPEKPVLHQTLMDDFTTTFPLAGGIPAIWNWQKQRLIQLEAINTLIHRHPLFRDPMSLLPRVPAMRHDSDSSGDEAASHITFDPRLRSQWEALLLKWMARLTSRLSTTQPPTSDHELTSFIESLSEELNVIQAQFQAIIAQPAVFATVPHPDFFDAEGPKKILDIYNALSRSSVANILLLQQIAYDDLFFRIFASFSDNSAHLRMITETILSRHLTNFSLSIPRGDEDMFFCTHLVILFRELNTHPIPWSATESGFIRQQYRPEVPRHFFEKIARFILGEAATTNKTLFIALLSGRTDDLGPLDAVRYHALIGNFPSIQQLARQFRCQLTGEVFIPVPTQKEDAITVTPTDQDNPFNHPDIRFSSKGTLCCPSFKFYKMVAHLYGILPNDPQSKEPSQAAFRALLLGASDAIFPEINLDDAMSFKQELRNVLLAMGIEAGQLEGQMEAIFTQFLLGLRGDVFALNHVQAQIRARLGQFPAHDVEATGADEDEVIATPTVTVNYTHERIMDVIDACLFQHHSAQSAKGIKCAQIILPIVFLSSLAAAGLLTWAEMEGDHVGIRFLDKKKHGANYSLMFGMGVATIAIGTLDYWLRRTYCDLTGRTLTGYYRNLDHAASTGRCVSLWNKPITRALTYGAAYIGLGALAYFGSQDDFYAWIIKDQGLDPKTVHTNWAAFVTSIFSLTLVSFTPSVPLARRVYEYFRTYSEPRHTAPMLTDTAAVPLLGSPLDEQEGIYHGGPHRIFAELERLPAVEYEAPADLSADVRSPASWLSDSSDREEGGHHPVVHTLGGMSLNAPVHQQLGLTRTYNA